MSIQRFNRRKLDVTRRGSVRLSKGWFLALCLLSSMMWTEGCVFRKTASVELYWRTEYEDNNYGYRIMRHEEGQTLDDAILINEELIPGKPGRRNALREYSLTDDKSPKIGKSYYYTLISESPTGEDRIVATIKHTVTRHSKKKRGRIKGFFSWLK